MQNWSLRSIAHVIATFAIATTVLFVADSTSRSPPVAAAPAVASTLSVSDYMLVVHGPKGLHSQIKEAVTGSGPADDKAWKALKARATTIVYLADLVLARAKPEKGDAASWKSKVGEYQKVALALAKAAVAKGSEDIKTEVGKLSKMCEGCHKAHK